jgi:hypothetical protein
MLWQAQRVPTSAAIVLIGVVRALCRSLCWLAASVGQTMVVLAAAIRVLSHASATYAPLTIPAQLVLLLAWAPTRLLFLTLDSAARNAYQAETHLRRTEAALD